MSVAPVLPTLYDYYTGGGIQSGLNAVKPQFTLNDKNITIYSGALHYFRVPKAYWRDRLRKLRAAGLNTVETYLPWNLHEFQKGSYDFGSGGSDMEEFLNVTEFLKIAQEEDLLAIVRPGPYICTEWEFGGLPSWLLREDDIKVRTSDYKFMKYVSRYFNVLLPILAALQFTKGGPIVAFQVENEYGSTEIPGKFIPDRTYLRQLRELMLLNGIVELLLTADSPTFHGDAGSLPGLFLQTANFGNSPEIEFKALQELQPNRPVMSMEFWLGWFDHWGDVHHTRNDDGFRDVYERILKYPASVNIYMFLGGTNFGFMNGANIANGRSDNSGNQPDTTSYDYDAPLTEAGDYTMKYVIIKELLRKYNPVSTRVPPTPHVTPKVSYDPSNIQSQMVLDEILENIPEKFISATPISMELLAMNNMSGQSFGYIAYRKRFLDIEANSTLTIGGRVCDSVVVVVDGVLISKPLNRASDLNNFGFWRRNNSQLLLGPIKRINATLVLLVENWGRTNFGLLEQFNQFKGLWQGGVFINDEELFNWEIIPLEFKKSWTNGLTSWKNVSKSRSLGPSLYKTEINIESPQDTFLDMQKWCKGIVIINNFVLGRYSRIGPQQALYLPAPFLKRGNNTVIVFEHYYGSGIISFSDKQIFKTRN